MMDKQMEQAGVDVIAGAVYEIKRIVGSDT